MMNLAAEIHTREVRAISYGEAVSCASVYFSNEVLVCRKLTGNPTHADCPPPTSCRAIARSGEANSAGGLQSVGELVQLVQGVREQIARGPPWADIAGLDCAE